LGKGKLRPKVHDTRTPRGSTPTPGGRSEWSKVLIHCPEESSDNFFRTVPAENYSVSCSGSVLATAQSVQSCVCAAGYNTKITARWRLVYAVCRPPIRRGHGGRPPTLGGSDQADVDAWTPQGGRAADWHLSDPWVLGRGALGARGAGLVAAPFTAGPRIDGPRGKPFPLLATSVGPTSSLPTGGEHPCLFLQACVLHRVPGRAGPWHKQVTCSRGVAGQGQPSTHRSPSSLGMGPGRWVRLGSSLGHPTAVEGAAFG